MLPRGRPDGAQARAGRPLDSGHRLPDEALHLVVGVKVQDGTVEFRCQFVADADHNLPRPIPFWPFAGFAPGIARCTEQAAQGFLWFRSGEVEALFAAAAGTLIAVQKPAKDPDHGHSLPGQGEAAVTGNPGQHAPPGSHGLYRSPWLRSHAHAPLRVRQ